MTGPDDTLSMPAAAGLDHGSARSDVLVVGAGPAGLVTPLLLGRRGWEVTVLERWTQPYPQPRAVHFDHEIARLLADAGIGAEIPRLSEPADV
jgi:2-polyprenyl-6-methoxyphenol hydroxylase-like FAD-dependent oxidoreductase